MDLYGVLTIIAMAIITMLTCLGYIADEMGLRWHTAIAFIGAIVFDMADTFLLVVHTQRYGFKPYYYIFSSFDGGIGCLAMFGFLTFLRRALLEWATEQAPQQPAAVEQQPTQFEQSAPASTQPEPEWDNYR